MGKKDKKQIDEEIEDIAEDIVGMKMRKKKPKIIEKELHLSEDIFEYEDQEEIDEIIKTKKLIGYIREECKPMRIRYYE